MANSQVCVGVVAGAHGVRGLLRVKSFTEEPKDVAAYGPLSDKAGNRRFNLVITGSAKGVLLAKIDGVTTREDAEALKGIEFYVSRESLPQTDEDEFYHADLIGLPAVLPDGTPFGTVRALHEFGAGDMIEILLEDGGVSVLPFTRATVPIVDVAAGKIVVEPPVETDARENRKNGDST